MAKTKIQPSVQKSAPYLKVISKLKTWQVENGYVADAELMSPHIQRPDNWGVLDANNNYNKMVEFQRLQWDPVNFLKSTSTIHPAFVVNNQRSRIFLGEDPASFATSLGFDQQLAACAQLNNGADITGFHQMTNAEWAMLAYSKNRPINGIIGSVWQRVGGMKIVDGEIQIIPDNDAADYLVDQSLGSKAYKAILQSGKLVKPGTKGTLKINHEGNISIVSKESGWQSKWFKNIECTINVDPLSPGVALLQSLGLCPSHDTDIPNGGRFYFNTRGEFVPLRGGYWNNGADDGVFALKLSDTRAYASWFVGLRLAFKL